MKILLLLLCVSASLWACAQCSDCQDNNVLASIGVGASKAGYNQTMEIGYGNSLLGHFGIYGGVKLASERVTTKNKPAVSSQSSPVMSPYIRVVWETFSIDDKFYFYNTVAPSMSGDINTSIRLQYRVGWKTVLGVEPFYGTHTGIGILLLLTQKITRD